MINNNIVSYVNNNGGITLNKNGNKATLNGGYMVSLYGTEYKTIDEVEVLDKIEEYLENIKDKEGLYVGVWLDEGYYYVDFSINILDEVEALEFGKKHRQISIYNIKEDSYLYIKDFSFERFYTIYDIVKDNEGNITDYKIDAQKNNINDLVEYFNLSIKTIKNSIYNDLQENYKQVINNRYIIIKDYILTE